MKKIFVFLMLVLSFTACTDNFDEDLIDPKRPISVPANLLFANAQRNLVDQMTTPSVNSGIFRMLSQQWAATTYPEESRYDLVTRNVPQNFWFTLYRDVLMDLREARKIIEADQTPGFSDAQRANQIAIIEVMEVYTWTILVDTFGNIPYTEALNPEIIYPKYDDAATIYTDLLARLNAAVKVLGDEETAKSGIGDFGTPATPGSSELIYGGKIDKWLMFANSWKLRMGMTLADVNAAVAQAAVQEAAPNVFKSAADNAIFKYTATTPNVNPIWTNLVQSGRNDFVPANTLVDVMKEYNDPRVSKYFEPLLDADKKPILDANGNVQYIGGIYGDNNIYANFSHVNPAITAANYPAQLLTYDEIQFYLAEAAARGYNTGATASAHFVNAIKASMANWGVADQGTAYLAQPAVAAQVAIMTTTGADGTLSDEERAAIGIQKWIALYNRGFEAWTEFRRLDYPKLQAPVEHNAFYNTVPVRYPYPPTERTLNEASVTASISTAGGKDDATAKLFWDKF